MFAVNVPEEASLRPLAVRHLPLVAEISDRLGIRRVIDTVLPRDKRMVVSDGECVDLMIANILHGRVALYHMGQWLEDTDGEVVLGEDCPPDAFTDDRLAATLDRLFEYGIDDVLSEVVTGYLRSDEAPDAYCVNTDTTTLKLFGAYEGPYPEEVPEPTWGHSKDHRPDLKQLVFGLSLHGSAGIPLCVSVLDGNTSDPVANRFHIEQLAGLLPPPDEVTLVADCKLFDPVTLGLVRSSDFHFVTLVPRTYNLREELVERVHASGEDLPELSRERGRTADDPDRVYRGRSYVGPFDVVDPETETQEAVDLRFLVVESSALAIQFEASLPTKLDKDRQAAERAASRLAKRVFECADDATAAAQQTIKEPRFHDLTLEVVAEKQAVKRARRGRPRTGEEQPTRTVFRVVLRELSLNEDAVAYAALHARYFVLATDHIDPATWSDQRILTEYRHQHIIEGHTGFRWLKGPAAVAPMFLKKPARIAALGIVFILALMVRNYIQFTLRRRLAEEKQTLPDMADRPTATPTTESAFRLFRHVMVICAVLHDRTVARDIYGLDDDSRAVLRLLGVSPAVFTTPRRKYDQVPCGRSE